MSRKLGVVVVVFGLIGLAMLVFGPGFGTSRGVPLWVSDRVPNRMSRLKPGMSSQQALAVLGLTGYPLGGIGNGPMNAYRVAYLVRPGMGLRLTFDGTRKPGGLLEGEIDGTDWSDQWALGLVVLIGVGGWLALPRRARTPLAPTVSP